MAEEKNLEGLQGWLILVGIGVVVGPLRDIAQVFPLYFKIFRSGDWSVLTTPGSEAYHPAWAPRRSPISRCSMPTPPRSCFAP